MLSLIYLQTIKVYYFSIRIHFHLRTKKSDNLRCRRDHRVDETVYLLSQRIFSWHSAKVFDDMPRSSERLHLRTAGVDCPIAKHPEIPRKHGNSSEKTRFCHLNEVSEVYTR
jgi:hypothetical protein